MSGETTRRQFFGRLARLGGFTAVGGLVWGWLLHGSRTHAFALRPPGAKAEVDYVATCIKCGMCVDACPYDTLALARAGEGGAPGVPYYVPRETPCYMCQDVPCARACPTGALDRTVEIAAARMGTAVLVDQETCLAFQGLRCEVCYRVCPLIGKAIALRFRPQARTGVHAFFEPVVNPDACTGCGMCEHACVLAEPAIRVLPAALARGRLAETYRFGWQERSAVSPDFRPEDAEPGEPVRRWEDESLERALKELQGGEKLYD